MWNMSSQSLLKLSLISHLVIMMVTAMPITPVPKSRSLFNQIDLERPLSSDQLDELNSTKSVEMTGSHSAGSRTFGMTPMVNYNIFALYGGAMMTNEADGQYPPQETPEGPTENGEVQSHLNLILSSVNSKSTKEKSSTAPVIPRVRIFPLNGIHSRLSAAYHFGMNPAKRSTYNHRYCFFNAVACFRRRR